MARTFLVFEVFEVFLVVMVVQVSEAAGRRVGDQSGSGELELRLPVFDERLPAMIVNGAWAQRNIGFDPTTLPATDSHNAEFRIGDLQRAIIDFDSESAQGQEFLAATSTSGLSKFTDIPWPVGLAPVTGPPPTNGAGPLPRADVLVVTWTVDEGHALSRVLTPGKDSHNDYVSYTHNFATIAAAMSKGSPAVKAQRLGAFWTTTIGDKSVVVFKSESHLSQDTDKHLPSNGTLPNAAVWKQIIDEVKPTLVLTTGTAGGIGSDFEVGDVVVSSIVRFDSETWLRTAPFAGAEYVSTPADDKFFDTATALFAANAGQLPRDNTRAPRIVDAGPGDLAKSVVTTDFFGFDTSDNHYGLWGKGDVSEMGDAVLGLVADELGSAAPPWLAVRNVSDPEIDATGIDLHQQAALAGAIYRAFGRWSSVCSAIVCWALIAAL